jgi:hypothetical protein
MFPVICVNCALLERACGIALQANKLFARLELKTGKPADSKLLIRFVIDVKG